MAVSILPAKDDGNSVSFTKCTYGVSSRLDVREYGYGMWYVCIYELSRQRYRVRVWVGGDASIHLPNPGR